MEYIQKVVKYFLSGIYHNIGGENLRNETLALLNSFMEQKIPLEYKTADASLYCATEEDGMKFDLMYCYEELFDYSWCMLHHHACNEKINFVGINSTALSDEFADCLMKLKQAVPSLHEYVNLLLEVIHALRTEFANR